MDARKHVPPKAFDPMVRSMRDCNFVEGRNLKAFLFRISILNILIILASLGNVECLGSVKLTADDNSLRLGDVFLRHLKANPSSASKENIRHVLRSGLVRNK